MQLSNNITMSSKPIAGIRIATNNIEKSMEKLSTGKTINSARDGVGDLSKINRLSTMAESYRGVLKNITDSQAMLEMAEISLLEVNDMISRVRELAVRASMSSITTTERTSISEETALLINQIDALANGAKYSDRRLLDGTFQGISIHNGAGYNESFTLSLPSVDPTNLGAYVVQGPARSALAAAQSPATNNTTDNEDISLASSTTSATIDVSEQDSAKAVATKINAISSETLISADGVSYAHLFSTNSSSASYTLKINDTTTSAFSISSSSVSDAVEKINLIAATTGVTASATTANKVLLHDKDGDDITIENSGAGSDLDVQAVASDGSTLVGSVISLASGGSTNNDATRVIGSLRIFSDRSFSVTQGGSSSLAYSNTGLAELERLSSLDVSNATNASLGLARIDSAQEQIHSAIGSVGAYMQRLQSSESITLVSGEHLEAAVSSLSDADFALESALIAKSMVLKQINSALLAQANASGSLVLKLLEKAA